MSESSVAPSLQQTEKDGGVRFACAAIESDGVCGAKQLCESKGLFPNRAFKRACIVEAGVFSGIDAVRARPLAQLSSTRRFEWSGVHRRCHSKENC